ncbi:MULTISPECIES: phosphopentomutase [unclassified Halomonas]|uniref:phosphopentomutase n=1 Tax=unclassified Halomonas TaxID=2609666 RepID=UPI002883C40D|nr:MULTISPECIES: phosphopentomutase [unclassified Halomonas]MDT0500809.1 phosphopentomutase [Halomonas sp. PAR7]MDT0513001.1 phosphopentomutase [Halomonas sp. LES1]MDT0591588.1 phosphopentomutase [Halomonas sp. PAR8]
MTHGKHRRAIVLVLDSFGIGAGPDAEQFGDAGADTLGHIAAACARGECEPTQVSTAGPEAARSGPLSLPNLARLGLFHAHHAATGAWAEGVTPPTDVIGAWGHAAEISSGKDTPSGHWELAGVPVRFDWGYFLERDNSFPEALLEALVRDANLPGVLGNCHASGTDIIARLGAEHLASGKPIVYTSADSVFQIAAHEEAFGLERLYALCETARRLLEPYNIGRVIARPFTGDAATGFTRTGNRRDYSIEPPSPTVLQRLHDAGGEVIAIGKIADIYAHCGISRTLKASGHEALMDATLAALDDSGDEPVGTLVMTNFVDFDTLYGHRRDVAGYAAALEAFDARLPELLARLKQDDLLILTADHGCDPTWRGTEHTREQVPVLALGGGLAPGPLGARDSFADIGQSLATWLGLPAMDDGVNFLSSCSSGSNAQGEC